MRPRTLFLLAAATLTVAACGSSRRTSPAVVTATTTATTTATNATPSTSQSLGSAGDQSSATRPPVGGPVPAGFVPASFTAISEHTFWLLGDAPCPRPVCTSIVRTTDGGGHFVGVPAPPARLDSGDAGSGLAELRFANVLDGFAGPQAVGATSALWETHDGGAHWTAGPSVVTFTVSAGEVYAIAGSCGHGTCSHLRLIRSPAVADRWSSTPLGVASSGSIALTAHGRSLWISLTPAVGTPSAQTLLASSDGGADLSHLSSPCTPGLGGDLEAASSKVVWAVCPTGMMAGAWRSVDAGAHWSPVHLSGGPGVELADSARIGPAGTTTALVSTGGTGPLLRTTNGGQSFAAVHGPAGSVTWIGFTDPSTATAIVATGGTPGLWRSSNGGAGFSGPLHIG